MNKVFPNQSPDGLNELFPHKICINLDRRPERWAQMQSKFQRHGIQGVGRFPAVDGQALTLPADGLRRPGAYGCLLSHLQVVREARAMRVPRLLIFEDDVVFHERLQDTFCRYISQVPPHWDMLYFGAMHMDDPIQVSENVYQVQRAYSTYAYALNHTIFDAFIELNSRHQVAVDVNNFVLQKERACYGFMPHLAWVETDYCYSDTHGRPWNHWFLKESLVLRGNGMNNLLKQTSVIVAHRNPRRSSFITQNLLFLIRFYTERLPGVSVIVVEQGTQPTLTAEMLPKGCEYRLLRKDGSLNRGLCFNAGMKASEAQRSFIIFSDSDIFVEELDIRANLRMCERYDCATGFRDLITLTQNDTLKLHGERKTHLLWFDLNWFDLKRYHEVENHAALSKYAVFNRRSIEAVGGGQEEEGATFSPLLKSRVRLSVFESPNYALRMHRDLAASS